MNGGTVEFYRQSLCEWGELNPSIDIVDTTVAEDNDLELENSGSSTHSVEETSHDPALHSICEKILRLHFEIEGESLMCASFEYDEPASFHKPLDFS